MTSSFLIMLLLFAGVLFFIFKQNQPLPSPLNTKEDVCNYLSRTSPYDCVGHQCIIHNDTGTSWQIFYICPSPEGDLPYRVYVLKVNKKTGYIMSQVIHPKLNNS